MSLVGEQGCHVLLEVKLGQIGIVCPGNGRQGGGVVKIGIPYEVGDKASVPLGEVDGVIVLLDSRCPQRWSGLSGTQ